MGSVDVLPEVVCKCVGDVCSHFLFHHSLPPAEAIQSNITIKVRVSCFVCQEAGCFWFCFLFSLNLSQKAAPKPF